MSEQTLGMDIGVLAS